MNDRMTDEAWRDAFALVSALLHDDAEGLDAVLDAAELRGLAAVLATVTAGTLLVVARDQAGECYERLSAEQRADLAKAVLINGLRAAGAPAPPMPLATGLEN